MTLRPPKARRSSNESGAAVILVLSLLVLVAVLTLAFLARTRTELVTADVGGRALEARRLAQFAADVIQVQILEATTNDQSPVWASQPGMIRTYGIDGSPSTRYKLFSADSMISSGETYDPTTEDSIPENWAQAVSEWVDLNTPEGLRYPIADPAAAEDSSVMGFEIGAGDAAVPTSNTSELPMPVKWLYRLEDGQLVAPIAGGFGQDDSGRSTQVVQIPGATERNPIVGRIAFWSDDETTKVNINTAVGHKIDISGQDPSPGIYHATPRFNTEFDQEVLVDRAPVKREYQRYRGHPATVSLGAVFPDFSSEELARIAPRATYGAGGSDSGFVPTDPDTEIDVPQQRLYATVDELAFNAERDRSSRLDAAEINEKRFFLTTRSSSPDLTPFGTPKISLLPSETGIAVSTDLDVAAERRLGAFSSSLRPIQGNTGFTGQAYHFTRENALAPEVDLPLGPGTTANRNTQVYNYLQRLLAAPQVPGFAGKPYPDKFGPRNTRQIGISIYDYIRASNLTGVEFAIDGVSYPTIDPTGTDGAVAGFGRIEILTELGIALIPVKRGQPNLTSFEVTEEGSSSKRNFHVHEYQAIALWEAFVPGQGFPSYGQNFEVRISNLDQLGIYSEEGFLSEKFIAAGDALTSRTAPLFPGIAAGAPTRMLFENPTTGDPIGQRGWGGTLPPSVPLMGTGGVPRTLTQVPASTPADATEYPFFGNRIYAYFPERVPPETPKMPDDYVFEIGQYVPGRTTAPNLPVPVALEYVSSVDQTKVISRFRANIGGVKNRPNGLDPAFSNFEPAAGATQERLTVAFPTAGGRTLGELQNRVDLIADTNDWEDLFAKEDAVRTFQPLVTGARPLAGGDLRLIAPRAFVDAASAGTVAGALPPAVALVERPDALLPRPTVTAAPSSSTPEPKTIRSLHSFSTNTGYIYPMQNPEGSGGGSRGFAYSPLMPGAVLTEYDNLRPPNEYPTTTSTALAVTRWSNIIDGTRAQILRPGLVTELNGDWDNGVGLARSGPYINFPDEGHTADSFNGIDTAYFKALLADGGERSGALITGASFPSAVMFGSLPTAVFSEPSFPARPWETLLFNPGPASGTDHHSLLTVSAGGGTIDDPIPDHVMLEYFRMPIVRPYALSSPAATSGRVNINSQIVPFTYIRRETALRAAFAGERVTAPFNTGGVFPDFKGSTSGAVLAEELYAPVDVDLALEGIRLRFAEGEIHKYPSEICEQFLVPSDTFSNYDENAFESYWENDAINGLVGDNERERPYASLYPKLTTKSNSYVVHVRAQVIRKARSGEVDQFDSDVDSVAGEWRGSFHLERTLPPSEPGIPDYAQELTLPTDAGSTLPSLEKFHRIRIERVERFAPAQADEKNRPRQDGGGLRGLL